MKRDFDAAAPVAALAEHDELAPAASGPEPDPAVRLDAPDSAPARRVGASHERGPAFWWACVLVAPPVAWLVASAGYGMAPHQPTRDLVLLALWSVGEEVVFRGGLQAALLKRIPGRAGGVSAANAVTSLLFAAAHLWAHPAPAALGVLPVSLVLGAAYERAGEHLGPPIVLHLYFNALLYAASRLLAT